MDVKREDSNQRRDAAEERSAPSSPNAASMPSKKRRVGASACSNSAIASSGTPMLSIKVERHPMPPALSTLISAENPILAALGGTPRSSAVASHMKPEPLNLNGNSEPSDIGGAAEGSREALPPLPPHSGERALFGELYIASSAVFTSLTDCMTRIEQVR